MQTLGFAYALEPAIRKLYPDDVEYEIRLRAHLDYFNTQPYLASFVLGAVVRMEEDRAAGQSCEEDIVGLKASLAGPLGALGDSFFWGALRPFAAVAAVAALLTGSWWAPLLFFALFNLWHVGLRTALLVWGYRSRGDAVALLERYRFTRMAKRFKVLSLGMLGGMIGLLPLWREPFRTAGGAPSVAVLAAGGGAVLLLTAALRRGGSPVQLMLGLAACCLLLAFAGVVS